MLLVIDIGNTNIKGGVYDGALLGTRRLPTPSHTESDFFADWLKEVLGSTGASGSAIEKTVVGSVVPSLDEPIAQACHSLVGHTPVFVTPDVNLPLSIEIDRPEQVGADRIANAAAGIKQFGAPCVIVDFGTATTFDCVSPDGAYVGGVIIPGPQTAMADLAQRAAKLFAVEIEPPERVIGRSTEQALQSGFFHGTVGQVDFIIERIIAELGGSGHHVIATGGLAGRIEKHSRFIEAVVPDLTLDGLRIIGEMN